MRPFVNEEFAMPLLHISMRAGKPEAYRKAILDGLYRAMREALNVPEGDEFMTISELSPANFRCGNAYGVTRSDDAVLIQNTRAEEGPVPADRGSARRKPGHSPRGRVRQRPRCARGELVRRPRRCAIRLSL
jgi:hypothetical protein